MYKMHFAHAHARAGRTLVVTASGRPSFGNDSRLILHGNSSPRKDGSRALIMPGQQTARRPPQMPPGQANFPELAQEIPDGMQDAQPIVLRNFRPPAGFMNDNGPMEDPTVGKSTEELISKLTSRSDYWFVLARYFPRLYREGLEGAVLEEMIDLTPARQNVWVVASNVQSSLRLAGLSKEQLDYFNNEDNGPECLMELRFLDIERRLEGARYIADNQLGPSDSVLLGRAIKEHERRGDSNEGFSRAAGDCLAFKYYRDAQESRSPAEISRHVAAGLRVAVTESAREKLRSQLPVDKVEDDGPEPELLMVRLSKEDVGTRVIAVVGSLSDATPQDVLSVPNIKTEGSFNVFGTPNSSGRYVALPRYNFLAVAAHPVALLIPDASVVPEILQATGSKNDKDAAKLKCQAMAIVDVGDAKEVKLTDYYLIERDGGVALAEGKRATNPLGRVLFIMMPHRRDALAAESFDV